MGISLANIDVGGVLGGLGTLAKNIREAITGESIIDPNKRAELLAQAAQIEADLVKAQTDINKIEAASSSKFVAGARPFILWICGFAFAWQYVAGPFLMFTLNALGCPASLPVLEYGELSTLLFGMLGFGGMRSYDKSKKNGS